MKRFIRSTTATLGLLAVAALGAACAGADAGESHASRQDWHMRDVMVSSQG
jgi:hypothetical protein